jgi:hypothetical protein
MAKPSQLQPIEVVFSFVRRIVVDLISIGAVALIIGVLILLLPEFLRLLMGALLVIVALWAFNLAYKVNKFSKIKFEI